MIADNEALGPDTPITGGLTMEKLLAMKAILDAGGEPIAFDEPWTNEELGLD